LAGNHRAQRPQRSTVPRRALIIAVILALIPATWITITRTLGDDDGPHTSQPTEKPIPPVSSGPTRKPSSTPSVTAAPTGNPLPRVAPDVPRRLTSGSVLDTGFDESVEPDGDSFTARTASEVARWGSRGEPGSPGTDTVYVVGRVENGGAFEDLGSLRAGDSVSIRTDNGTLGYTVRAVSALPESGLVERSLFTAKAPGRLVLVGVRGSDYLVVTAQLTAATAS